jgi:hypothetical protein
LYLKTELIGTHASSPICQSTFSQNQPLIYEQIVPTISLLKPLKFKLTDLITKPNI